MVQSMIKLSKMIPLFLLLFTLSLLGAATIENTLPGLSDSEIVALQNGSILFGNTLSEPIQKYAPQGSNVLKKIEEAMTLDNAFSISALSFIPYKEEMKSMDQSERQLILFNTMRSISTQEGITYISHRAGNKPRVLIEKSWYLSTPKSRQGVNDPVVDQVPATDTRFVYQRDSTFGGNIYRHEYTTNENEINVEVKNIENLKVFSLFNAVRAEQLTISMATYQIDEGILLFGFATITDREPQIKIFGYVIDLPSSFMRRVTALQEWFINEFDK